MLRRRGRAPGEPPPVEAVRDRQGCMVTKVCRGVAVVWAKSGIFSPCVELQFWWVHCFFWNVTTASGWRQPLGAKRGLDRRG